MKNTTYQAAQKVSKHLFEIFSRHFELAQQGEVIEMAEVPSQVQIEKIIDVAFWASLRKEESHSTRVSLAFLSPKQTDQPILFAQSLDFNPHNLTKISPGFERPGIHLGVWCENGELFVWGATSSIPDSCFVLDVSEPGLVVIKHRRFDGFGKFANIAVLNGDEIKIIDDRIDNTRDCPFLLKSLMDFNAPSLWNHSVNILLQLAVSMRSHRRGGTLLLVPSANSNWKNSIRTPLHYHLDPNFSGLAKLLEYDSVEQDKSSWIQSIYKEIDLIAGLTAIDGAIIMNDKYELLAFGEKIRRSEGSELVDQILLTEPIRDVEPKIVHPSLNGGTRHSSAAQFIHDQREAIAMVASQDGLYTVFAWSSSRNMVQAHRIETLLI